MKRVPYKVLLPKRIWDMRRDRERFRDEILSYLQAGYPDYVPVGVKNGFVLCERRVSDSETQSHAGRTGSGGTDRS